jgi:hypothetical protein
MRQISAFAVSPSCGRLAVRGLVPTTLTAAAVLLAAASPSLATLGSFSPNEGYTLSMFVGNTNWVDVSYYNAGGYGPNAGGGPGPFHIAPNSGSWRVVGEVGGFYSTSAMRNAVVGGAPPYPLTAPGSLPIYIVGNHGPGRTDGSALAFRNDTPIGTVGPAVYDYSLDIYDTGGVNPTSVTSGPVSHKIYFNATPEAPPVPGLRAGDKFHLSMMDSLGNIGAQWGYARDNEIVYRPGSAGPWIYTGQYATAGSWDGMNMQIDLTSDTFQLDYYDVGLNVWITLAPAGTPLGTPMNDLSQLRWQLEDGVNSGLGGKNFFDDSTFIIPAPGAAMLLGLGGLAAMRRRR